MMELYFFLWLCFAASIFVVCYGISSYLYNISSLLPSGEFRVFGYTMAILSIILILILNLSLQ